MEIDEDVELSECSRCETRVPTDTLQYLFSWKVCEICMDDI